MMKVFILVVWLLVGWSVYLVRKVYISVVQQLDDCSADFITNEEGIFVGGLPARRLVSQRRSISERGRYIFQWLGGSVDQ